jgi:hypothetical protein
MAHSCHSRFITLLGDVDEVLDFLLKHFVVVAVTRASPELRLVRDIFL